MQDLFEFTGQTVRVAGILIAVLIMLVETEWSLILAQMPLLDFWIGRGVLQVRPVGASLACGCTTVSVLGAGWNWAAVKTLLVLREAAVEPAATAS